MIGLDTNVVVRYIMQDDPKQSQKAASHQGADSIVELVWVLGFSYKLAREQIAQVLSGLLRSKEIVVDRAELVGRAVRVLR
jgi:predicted nucleic-acid-binding protein